MPVRHGAGESVHAIMIDLDTISASQSRAGLGCVIDPVSVNKSEHLPAADELRKQQEECTMSDVILVQASQKYTSLCTWY